MVEVNPVVLLAAGTVLAGIVTILCTRGGGKKKAEAKPAAVEKEVPPAVAATSKPKKRSKPRNKAKKSSASKEVAESSSEAEPAAPAVAAAPASVAVDAEQDEDDKGDDQAEEFFMKPVVDASKKPKKAKETQEQKASRLERQKQQKSTNKTDDDVVFFSDYSATSIPAVNGRHSEHASSAQGGNGAVYDGWAVVENSRKLKKKSESTSDLDDIPPLMANTPPVVAAAPPSAPVAMVLDEAPAAPPVDTVTRELIVESRKLGLLIGPKGVTKIGMQTATGTEITMPKVEKDHTGPVTITVTGPAEGVDRAVHALNELCTKGYCNLLASPDFHESYVEVKPKFLPDIIGKGGASIRAIQAHTGVKISTPSDYTKVLPSGETVTPSKVKIILAGNRDKVSVARGLILDLCKYYYTPVTHPGMTHVEMSIDPRYYNYVIGSKGSEIKHIQANYKVTVHIPNAESANQNLLIVGEASNAANAEQHILRLMQKVDDRAKAEAEGIALGESAKAKLAAAAGNGPAEGAAPGPRRERAPRQRAERDAAAADGSAPRGPKDPNAPDLEDEAWTAEYAPRRAPIDLSAMLPATAKFSAAPTVVTPTSPVADPTLGAAL